MLTIFSLAMANFSNSSITIGFSTRPLISHIVTCSDTIQSTAAQNQDGIMEIISNKTLQSCCLPIKTKLNCFWATHPTIQLFWAWSVYPQQPFVIIGDTSSSSAI
jgi:hypothetical protein